jgi:hypothetical protein
MSHHTVAAALFSAVVLSTGAAGSAGAADLCLIAQFECFGSEPFWRFITTVDGEGKPVVHFIDPDSPGGVTEPVVVDGCLLQENPNDFELTTDAPLSLVASIVGQSCTEADGEVRDFAITLAFDRVDSISGPFRAEGTGCCTRLD